MREGETTSDELMRLLVAEPTVTTDEARRQLGLTAESVPAYRAIPRQRHNAAALPYVKESQPIRAAAG
jgi:hypothetical protein